MAEQKKKIPVSIAEADVEFKQSVDALTEVLIEELKGDYRTDLEPFDAYAQRVRAQVHANMQDFRDRFLEGYEVLLQELVSQQTKAESIQDKPPPGTIIL